jgi:hypothetical protein
MTRIRNIAIAAALSTVGLALPGAAGAKTVTVGSTQGMPSMNICVADIDCTYISLHNGRSRQRVPHTGTIKSWSLNAASVGGKVRLRVLRPIGHQGKYKLIRESALRTVSDAGVNTFPSSLRVKKNDVLALQNSTSGLYFAQTGPHDTISFYELPDLMANMAAAPNRNQIGLRLLLSANVNY